MKTILEPTGRITRRKYLVLFVLFYFINLLCIMLIYESIKAENWLTFAIFGILLITTIVLLLVQAIKRLHDIGMDWKYALYLLIPPPINLIGFVYLAIKPGQNGTNKFGASPRKTDVV
ncbi:DUF805 domain-containing protein [Echinicola strongylocentroti]|uniref:DUF805 domain-containing protein n=1 Tax=Echinicola strongylocentroti TaxID=1795355 RepID=A0A2Z4IN04_9BACT|nr:DUF805 domain-containing protein [Echinicola strongylocentroti]AWW31763.1 DUF805 domain-containing protein [Echinicola strongylocentroti]